MKKLTHLALLCAIVIIGLLIPPVMAVETAPGEHIYRSFSDEQSRPDIDGDMIVWEDDRYGDKDIYFGTVDEFRQSSGNQYIGTRITDDSNSQEKPSISGDYIVWQDNRNENWDIYLYQRSTGRETQLTTSSDKQWLPIVRGNYVAWYEDNGVATNVVLYDIAAGSVKRVIDCDARTTIPFVSTEFKPTLSDKYVAWVEEIDQRVRYYDIAAGTIAGPVSASEARQSWPTLSGSLITWEDYRHGSLNADIYMTDLDALSGGERQITSNATDQVSPAISGSIIAWEDKQVPARSIFMYDLSTGKEMSVFLSEDEWDEQLYPAVSDNTIVWQRGSNSNANLYIFLYEPEDPVATSIEVTPATATLEVGDTQEFAATVRDQNGDEMTGVTVIWASTNETVGTIDADGTFTALAEGTASVTATAEGITGTATVTVTSDEPVVTTIEVEPTTVSLTVGDTVTFSATVLDQNGGTMTGITVAWTSDNETVGTINPDGVFTALAEGTTTINATVGDVFGTATVTVTDDEPVVTTIEVEPDTTTLAIDDTEQFSAIVRDQFGDEMSGVDVTWECGNETVGTIDTDGVFTALATGNTTVIATADSVAGTATVTVSAEDPVLENIKVTPTTATLAVNDTGEFTATLLDQFGNEMTGVEIAWTSDNETVGTVDDTGLFTALAAGTATVTASAGDVAGTATVTVEEQVAPVVTSIEVAPATATVMVGDTREFDIVCSDESGNTMTGVPVTWSCSSETVGTIDADGVFTALAVGTVTITATAGDVAGTADVTVNAEEPVEPVVTTLTVTPPRATLDIDDIQRFIVTAYDQDGNVMPEVEIDWACSDETVGTIDGDGFFTALAGGTTTVTATAGDVAGTADVTVNAEEPALAWIAVSPSAVTLEVGDTREFCVVAFDRFGNIVPDAEITWECSDGTVGMIDEGGIFTALDDGTATVTATGDGAEGTATVTVNCDDPVLSRIVVTPAAITLAAGDSETFTATALDQDGCEMPGVDITWECSDDTIADLDDTGFFTALAAGTATVTATSGGVTATADVEVTDDCSGVVVSPSAIILDPGDSRKFTATVYDLQDNASDPTVTWSCNDEGVGTITAGGLFTAVCGGTATVTASVAGVDETCTGTAAVTVRSMSPELARIEVSPSDFCIPAGNSLALTATAFDQYGFPMDVEVAWESSDETVGTIDECGVFTALADGEVTLTASADGVSGSSCVTVEPSLPVPACIEVEPATATLEAGEIQEFTATVFDQCDNEMEWVRVAWSCSDADVGTIDRAGLFAAFAEGSTDVIALAGGVEGTAAVTITAAPAPEPTPNPTQTPKPNKPGNSGGSTDSDGWSPPTLSVGICENLKSGETFTFSDITVSSVGSVAITAANNIPKMLVTVKETTLPNLAEPPGGTYEYVEIALSWVNQNDISGATVTFTIPARWLEEHDMLPEDVRLMRYVDGGWQILETEVIGEENGNYRFRATTPGFSTFAIAAMPDNVTVTTDTNATTGETNVTATVSATEDVTTEPTTAVPTTTPAAPLVYAPFLAPLAFLLWRRRKN